MFLYILWGGGGGLKDCCIPFGSNLLKGHRLEITAWWNFPVNSTITLYANSLTMCYMHIIISLNSFRTSSVQPSLNWGMISLRWPVMTNNKGVVIRVRASFVMLNHILQKHAMTGSLTPGQSAWTLHKTTTRHSSVWTEGNTVGCSGFEWEDATFVWWTISNVDWLQTRKGPLVRIGACGQ